MLIASCCSK